MAYVQEGDKVLLAITENKQRINVKYFTKIDENLYAFRDECLILTNGTEAENYLDGFIKNATPYLNDIIEKALLYPFPEDRARWFFQLLRISP
jgi:hypothetical protein